MDAGIILLTGLSFASGVLMMSGAVLAHRSHKVASPVLIIAFATFMVTLIAGMWVTTFGAPWHLSLMQKWVLVSIGPGVSLLAFLSVILMLLLHDLVGQRISLWAKAVGTLYVCSLMVLAGNVFYPDWLDKVYGWQGYSAFMRGPLGTLLFDGAMVVILGVMFYNKFYCRRKHER